MPPCMQTSVAPASHASSRPVGDLVERQRVGVGVALALGERAEPAADVADVGEVDVAVDDVGDVVADRRRGAGRRPAPATRPAPARRRSISARRCVVAAGRAGSRSAARSAGQHVGVDALEAPRGRQARAPGLADRRPSRRRRCRSRRGGLGARPRCRSPRAGRCRPSRRREAAVGLLPRPARPGRTSGAPGRSSGRPARRRVRDPRVDPRLAPACTYSGCAVSRCTQVEAGLGGDGRELVELRATAARG